MVAGARSLISINCTLGRCQRADGTALLRQPAPPPSHRRRSSVNFGVGGQDIFARKYVYEKLTKWPNFYMRVARKNILPNFKGHMLPPFPTPMPRPAQLGSGTARPGPVSSPSRTTQCDTVMTTCSWHAEWRRFHRPQDAANNSKPADLSW